MEVLMMNEKMIKIDPNYENVATSGSNLIEASAGTGKTFSILRIYLRFLLKHLAEETPLSIDQLLLVTFTNAAAQEMRERLLEMFTNVYNYCAGIEHKADKTLTEIIDQTLRKNSNLTKQNIADYLNELMGEFDKAPVFTIHSFCGRVQQEWFPKAGLSIEQRMRIDSKELIEQVCKDYWRRQVTNPEQSDLLADWFREQFEAPVKVNDGFNAKSLANSVKGVESSLSISFNPEPEQIVKLASDLEEIFKVYHDLKKEISQYEDPESEVASVLKSVKIRSNHSQSRAGKLIAYLSDELGWLDDGDLLRKLDSRLIEEKAEKKNIEIDPPHWSVLCSELDDLLSDFNKKQDEILAGILSEIHSLVRERCESEALITHDLQLKYMLQGLISSPELPPMLAEHYKCIMVDEFQDTDSTQFEIFDRIYQNGDDENAVYYIGDPKQSIYSFRNADIDTYLKAKNQVDRIYTLDTNYRSSTGQISAVNELFNLPNEHDLEPFAENGIPFNKVEAQKSEIFLTSKDEYISDKGIRLIQPGTKAGLDKENLLSSDDALHIIVDEIVSYLKAGKNITIRDEDENGELKDRPVETKDIAVIVSKHKDAEQLKSLLAERGLGAVLYNRPSVFKSDEARWATYILKAVIDPQNISQLKLALTSPFFDVSTHDFIRWSSTDEVPEDLRHYQHLFIEWHQKWESTDISTLFQAILNTENRRERLLSADQGDRKITNIQHIVDVLSTYERERNTTPVGVLQYLKLKRQQADRSETDEDDEIKLETDEDLIKIMTVFRSKGLEFNIVFTALNFAMSSNRINDFVTLTSGGTDDPLRDTIVVGQGRKIGGTGITVKDAQKLSNAKESIRKFYVALTRSVYQTVVVEYFAGNGYDYPCVPACLMKEKQEKKTLDQLQINKRNVGFFFNDQKSRFQHISIETKSKPDKSNPGEKIDLKNTSSDERKQREMLFKKQQENIVSKHLPAEWRIGSYTGLSKLSKNAGDNHNDMTSIERSGYSAKNEDHKTIYDMKAGAQTGNLLHTIFEYIDFERREEQDHVREVIHEQCRFYGYEAEEWESVLMRLVETTFNKPMEFGEESVRLRDLKPGNLKKEMEFYIDHQSYQLRELLELFRESSPVDLRQLKGYIKGYIDLAFIHNGRFYLLDYKSNFLGDQVADYSPEIIKQDLAKNGYDIQYHLYAYAAHRILGSMIPDYDYEKHFGGVCYLYFRGLEGEGQSGVFTTTTEPNKDTILKMDSLLGRYHE
jgi:exodeoxyribonuclease V beta subunit